MKAAILTTASRTGDAKPALRIVDVAALIEERTGVSYSIPRGLRDMRHDAAWIFGAISPERDTGVALVVPEATVPAMQALIDELAGQLPADRRAVLVMDRDGWHIAAKLTLPDTITPLHLPSYSPDLNPIERVWLYLRERFLSHRLFDPVNAIVDACATPGTPFWPNLDASPNSVTTATDGRSIVQGTNITFRETKNCKTLPI